MSPHVISGAPLPSPTVSARAPGSDLTSAITSSSVMGATVGPDVASGSTPEVHDHASPAATGVRATGRSASSPMGGRETVEPVELPTAPAVRGSA